MATHVSLLARIIPQTEEPGRLKFMGLQRVRHNVLTDQQSEQLKNCILKFDTWSITEFFALMLIFLHALMPRAEGREGYRVMSMCMGFLSGMMKQFWRRQG